MLRHSSRTSLFALFLTAWSACTGELPPGAHARASAGSEVRSIALTVADLADAERFFSEVLGFQPDEHSRLELTGWTDEPALHAERALLHAGDEHIELIQYAPAGRAAPEDSRSHDGWFQHLALVTRDIDAMEARVRRAGASPISTQTQTIPASNPAAGGIRAFYFRGPAGHPLELIWYPPGKGQARWQRGAAPVLGVDHTAIAVADSARSRAFYAMLGLHVAGTSFNFGSEQAALSGVPDARVRITGLRAAAGPGVELLEYEAPRDGRLMPPDTRASDLWHCEISLQVPELEATVTQLRAAGVRFVSQGIRDTRALVPGTQRGVLVLDPDGHAVRVVQ